MSAQWPLLPEEDGRFRPRYLTSQDYPWLCELVEHYQASLGAPRRELDRRLIEPLRAAATPSQLKLARGVLDSYFEGTTEAAVAPALARLECAAARTRLGDPTRALTEAAGKLGLSEDTLEAAWFADLPDEQRLCQSRELPPIPELALAVNQALVAGLLRRSAHVSVVARGQVRQLVRHIALVGLILQPSPEPDGSTRLELSGPLSLMRQTLVYGRALATLVPRLKWCDELTLEARCVLSRSAGERLVQLSSGDPLPVTTLSSAFDSQLERRFARTLPRLAPDWELRREPSALRIGGKLVFPDFELYRRHDPSDRHWVELCGYHTPDYLRRKLALLDEPEAERLILCVDASRAEQAEVPLPEHPRLLPFRKSLDPRALLAHLRIQGPPTPPPKKGSNRARPAA